MTDEPRADRTDIARLDVTIVDPGETDQSSFGLLPRAALLAKTIAHTDFVKASLRGKPAAVAAAILTGHELGIGPMMALSRLNVIDGQVVLDAQGMRALVQSKGHEIFFTESTSTRCTAVGIRRGSSRETAVTWTIEDARRAKLLGKPRSAWEAYPRAMLVARATSELCRMIFSDVLGGVAYSAEEIADGLEGLRDAPADGTAPAPAGAVDGLPPETPAIATRQAPRRRRRAEAADDDPLSPAAPVGTPAPPPPPSQETWADLEVPGDVQAGAPEPGEAREASTPEAPPAESLAPPVSPPGEKVAIERAQEVAMWCRDAGIDDVDRPQLVSAASNGRVTSARELTEEEAARALDMARAIQRGEKKLMTMDDGRHVVTYRDVVEVRDEALALLQRLMKADKEKTRVLLVGAGWKQGEAVSTWVARLPHPQVVELLPPLRQAVAQR